MRRIVIAGGNGFIGEYLHNYFVTKGIEVVLIVRKKVSFPAQTVLWDGEHPGSWESALEGTDLLINLAGKSVNCRYNEKNKRQLFHSRLHTTELLGNALQKCQHPPKLWLNASSATVYRHAEDRPMDELTGEEGKDFSPSLVQAWEKKFYSFQIPGIRQVAMRMAITLGKEGGVMPYYVNLVKNLVGGKQGKGTQKYSWIHAEDLARAIEWIGEHEDLTGNINLSAPNPVTNSEFMKTVRDVYGTPVGLPMPTWMLKMGAFLIGTETELLLKSRWVVPTRMLQSGFVFKYPVLEEAVKASV